MPSFAGTGFSLLYTVHLLVLAAAWAGRDVCRHPTLRAVVGLLLPVGHTCDGQIRGESEGFGCGSTLCFDLPAAPEGAAPGL